VPPAQLAAEVAALKAAARSSSSQLAEAQAHTQLLRLQVEQLEARLNAPDGQPATAAASASPRGAARGSQGAAPGTPRGGAADDGLSTHPLKPAQAQAAGGCCVVQ
jgi:hypothetical protein